MKCGICEKKKKNLTICKICNVKFCSDCGNAEREMCDLCTQFEEAEKSNEVMDS